MHNWQFTSTSVEYEKAAVRKGGGTYMYNRALCYLCKFILTLAQTNIREYVTKDGNKFPSLEKLISYFTTSTSGDLPCKLTSYTTHFDEEIEQILGQGATYENTDLL